MKRLTVELCGKFHDRALTVLARPTLGSIPGCYHVTPQIGRRIRRALCGVSGCGCLDIIGITGRIDGPTSNRLRVDVIGTGDGGYDIDAF